MKLKEDITKIDNTSIVYDVYTGTSNGRDASLIIESIESVNNNDDVRSIADRMINLGLLKLPESVDKSSVRFTYCTFHFSVVFYDENDDIEDVVDANTECLFALILSVDGSFWMITDSVLISSGIILTNSKTPDSDLTLKICCHIMMDIEENPKEDNATKYNMHELTFSFPDHEGEEVLIYDFNKKRFSFDPHNVKRVVKIKTITITPYDPSDNDIISLMEIKKCSALEKMEIRYLFINPSGDYDVAGNMIIDIEIGDTWIVGYDGTNQSESDDIFCVAEELGSYKLIEDDKELDRQELACDIYACITKKSKHIGSELITENGKLLVKGDKCDNVTVNLELR